MKTLALVAALLVSCTTLTPQEKTQVADSAYAAEMMKCVDDAATLEQSKSCRAAVRTKWNVVDGGVSK